MKEDFLLPQGRYKMGRDIPEGSYLIAAVNGDGYITIEREKGSHEYYTLDDDNGKICHVELVSGETIFIEGKVKIRHISKPVSDNSLEFDLLSEIEDFTCFINGAGTCIKTSCEEVGKKATVDESKSQYSGSSKNKMGFWSILGMLISESSSSGNSSSCKRGSSTSPKKKDTGHCDGDCANCPPHYGYRYGRWYYGHAHQHGCQRGGNGGASGKCYRD